MKFNRFKNISLVTLSLLSGLTCTTLQAEDYTVLAGTFFMSGGVTPSPVAIVANGGFSDTTPAFLGDFTCGADAQCASVNPNGFVDPNATENGLDSFTFFGAPVRTYFAPNGADGLSVNHPPPSIDLVSGTADVSSWYANWNGTEFNQGNSNATVTDNFDGTYRVGWSSLIVGGPFDGFTGTWTWDLLCDTCPPQNPGPAPTLNIVQNAVTTHTVTLADGNYTVSTDLASTAGYTFNWAGTDDAVDGGSTTNTNPTVTFDPTVSGVGTFGISVVISDTNFTPPKVAKASIIINVIAAGVLADIGDDDNDGIQNVDDGIDNIATPTLLQTRVGDNVTFLMESSAGSLKIGSTAFCTGTSASGVTLTDIEDNGGAVCAAAPANIDDNLHSVISGIGGYYDFEVHGLTQGETVDIVIPLDEALPENASYRKYSIANGWNPFDVSSGDSIASTSSGSTGHCPEPFVSVWTEGLTEGDDCIRLSITDGGTNDADGLLNGIVVDPGTISYYPGIGTNDLGGSVSWSILVMMATWLGVARRRSRH